jgi:hypothetical protein
MEELRQRILPLPAFALLCLFGDADIDHGGTRLGHQTRKVRQPGDTGGGRRG